jgi:hypothetical protein
MKKRSFSSQSSKDSNPNAKNTPNSSNANNPNQNPLMKKNSLSSLNKNSILSRINSNSGTIKEKNSLSGSKQNIISLKRASSSSLGSIEEIPEGGPNSDFESNIERNNNIVSNFSPPTNQETILNNDNQNIINKNSNLSNELPVNQNLPAKKAEYSLKRAPSVRPAIRKKNSLIESDKNNPSNNSEIKIKNYEEKKELSFFQKIWNKLKKNFFLMLTVIFMIYVYYVYIFVRIKYIF